MPKPSSDSNGQWSVALVLVCVAAIIIGAIGGVGGDDEAKPREPQKVSADKLAVYDGDTLRWPDDRPLRLLQVNAPERSRCAGEQATVRLAELVGTKGDLQVVYDPKLKADRFGRVLAYLDKDGKDLGEQLVREGYARAYFINKERGVRADRYLKAQSEAREARRGLWACPR